MPDQCRNGCSQKGAAKPESGEHVADEGAAVVVNYASSKAGADRVVADITRREGKAVAVQADVAKKEDVHPIAVQIGGALAGLDVLIHNASSLGPVPLALLADTAGAEVVATR